MCATVLLWISSSLHVWFNIKHSLYVPLLFLPPLCPSHFIISAHYRLYALSYCPFDFIFSWPLYANYPSPHIALLGVGTLHTWSYRFFGPHGLLCWSWLIHIYLLNPSFSVYHLSITSHSTPTHSLLLWYASPSLPADNMSTPIL